MAVNNFHTKLRATKTWAVFTLVVATSACTSLSKPGTPVFPFIDKISTETKNSIAEYDAHQTLSNGLEYGNSVRFLNLRGESVASLSEIMNKTNCPLTKDVIKGSTTQILIWLCPDGGVVRAKPVGDPTNKYRPQPHASKALRYPFNAAYKGFESETVKIDNEGHAYPKSPEELNSSDSDVINSWANATHTDLRP